MGRWRQSLVILGGRRYSRSYRQQEPSQLLESIEASIVKSREWVGYCNQLKLVASDSKRYLTDCLPQDELLGVLESVPSKHASAFARQLITVENQIDSKSHDTAYQLWDSTVLQIIEVDTTRELQQIYAWTDNIYISI